MKPLVSVIVPVYKVEPYLERCLDSLVAQTMKEIEIIVIDDGSPDRCGEICDAYAAKDARFRVVHQENRGLSAARNVGIELARADYLMFVDSDDWVDPEFCRLPYEAAVEHGAELVIFRYHRIIQGTEHVFEDKESEGIKETIKAMYMIESPMIGNYAWNKLYIKNLFRSIRFPEGRYYEDIAVQPLVVNSADRIYYLNDMLYYYQKNEGSITMHSSEKSVVDYYEMRMQAIHYLEAWGYHDLAQSQKQSACFAYLLKAGRKKQYSEECESYFRTLNIPTRDITIKRKVMLILLRYVPLLFDLACIIRGKRIR